MPKALKKTIIISGAIIMLVIAAFTIFFITREKITFQDAAFEASIKKALNKNDTIYNYDLYFIDSIIILSDEACLINREADMTITERGCLYNTDEITSYGEITSLEDIKYFPKLKKLTVINNMVTTLPDLMNSKIEYMNLAHNSIVDIKNIGQYKTLYSINLSYNMIKDISNVSLSQTITNLNLKANAIGDAQVLASVQDLKELNISYNYLNNVDFLSSLKGLSDLDISHNEIDNLSAIADLNKLSCLNISFNRIKAIEKLNCGSSLKYLNAMNNEISYINTTFEKLREGNLANNALKKDFDLAQFPSAEIIQLDFNQISNLINFPKERLHTLTISCNELRQVEFTCEMNSITNMDISGNPVDDISSVSQFCPKLVQLNISDTKVTDISTLKSSRELNTLVAFNLGADTSILKCAVIK
ncbi:leucine-rich repeat domain-containing protein [Acetanaerobacterium elongatum]|uniref:Uncharacterized protein n=1 Tax=Acetanaerobacterium elongatum TaxID=258515 RepID=A0A1H0CE50_9FIRM|nr:hypothetical protein [Acetanaerobacterium elongatum]SDN56184.1 hypothetical protein SAMN05192585_1235 [Acetanaerobacterium elongatum]